MPGLHNRLNAVAALAAANSIRENLAGYLAALSNFRGIRRRMERLYDQQKLIVFDDFAHHPTAVAAAIDAVREAYPDHKIIAVFEPRSNTSVRNFFQADFLDAFSRADQIIIGSLHREQNIPQAQRLNTDQLIGQLVSRGREARRLANHEILDYLTHSRAESPSVYLFMSNGSFDGIPSAFVDRLNSNIA
jgi:UDP-N-acetylmuramate: L-alanyl-gamma-D-glutamyl-meso-diaminopimelate ligase